MADEGFQKFQQKFGGAQQPTAQQTQNTFANPAVSQTQQALATQPPADIPIPGKKPKPDPNQAMEYYAEQIQKSKLGSGNISRMIQDKATWNRVEDNQAVAPQLGADKMQSAGTGINPQTGETEHLGIGTRANIGLTENTFDIFEDKVAKFKSVYNEQTGYKLADMRQIKDKDGDDAVVFTLDGAHWARVKPTFFEKLETFTQVFGKKDKNETDRYLERNVAWEVLNDLADNPVDVIIATAASLATGGATGVLQAGRLAFAPAMITKTGGALTEKVMGYGAPSSDGKIDFLESTWEGAKTGVLEALFAAAGMSVSKLGSLLSGGGGMNIPEGWRKLIEAAHEMGMPGLMPQQVSRSPFLRRQAAHAEGLRQKITNYRDSQMDAATDKVKSMYDPALTTSGDPNVADPAVKEIDDAFKNYRNDLITSIKSPGVPFTEAAKAITGAIDEYRETTGLGVKKLYEVAMEKGNAAPVTIDLTKAQEFATHLRDGKYTLGEIYATFQGQAGKEKARIVPDKETDLGFRVDQKTVPSGPKVQYSKKFEILKALDDINSLSPELQSIVFDIAGDFGKDSIAAMKPKLTVSAETDLNPIEALNSIRARLYPLTLPDPKTGALRGDEAQAKKLYALLNDALENGSDFETNQAFKFASQKARERMETLEQAKLSQLYRAEDGGLATDPVSIARTILSGTGRNPGNLEALHNIMPGQEWTKVQDAVITDIVRDPEKMLSKVTRLMEFPEENALLFKGRDAELSQIMKVAKELKTWQKGELGGLVDFQKRSRGLVEGLILRGDKTAVAPMIKDLLYNGYSKTQASEAIRASILDYFVKSSLVSSGADRQVLSSKAFEETLKAADRAQLQLFLKPDDWKTLDFVRQYINAVERGQFDSGMNLQSAGTMAKMFTNLESMTAYYVTAPWAGFLLTSKAGQKFIMGRGATPPSSFPAVLAAFFGGYAQNELGDSYDRAHEQTKKTLGEFGGAAANKVKDKVNDAFK
jgi:hypothetical protein